MWGHWGKKELKISTWVGRARPLAHAAMFCSSSHISCLAVDNRSRWFHLEFSFNVWLFPSFFPLNFWQNNLSSVKKLRCFNLIFLEETFKPIKVHLFSLFKDATPVFLAENLNGMPFFLQKRDGQPLPWLGPYIISFLLFFPLWIENASPKCHIDEEFKTSLWWS